MATASLDSSRTPSSISSDNSTDTSRSRSNYKRIRFKPWKPDRNSSEKEYDIIQWQPPTTSLKDDSKLPSETRFQLLSPKPQRREKHDKQNPKDESDFTSSDSGFRRNLSLTRLSPDPCESLGINSTPWVPSAINFFTMICGADKFGRQNDADRTHNDLHITRLLPFAMQNTVVLESLVTICRVSLLAAQGISIDDDKEYIYHRGKAIHLLAQKLRSEEFEDDATLLSVSMMVLMEYFARNHSGMTAHLAGLKRLMQLRANKPQGDSEWDVFVQRGMIAVQSLGACTTGSIPTVPRDSLGFTEEIFIELNLDKPISYPGLPFSPDICTVISRIPSGFGELCISQKLSIQVIHLLSSFTLTTSLATNPTTSQERLTADIQTMLAAIYRLSQMSINSIEKLVANTLVAYLFQIPLQPLNLFHDPPLKGFIELLSLPLESNSSMEQNLIIWTMMNIAGALALRTVRMPGSHSILDRAFDLYPQEMTNWERLEIILRSFFWTDALISHWQEVWRDAMHRYNQLSQRQMSNQGGCDPPPDKESGHNPCEENGITGDIGSGSESQSQTKDGDEIITLEQIIAHHRGAPGSIRKIANASRCPFLSKMSGKSDMF